MVANVVCACKHCAVGDIKLVSRRSNVSELHRGFFRGRGEFSQINFYVTYMVKIITSAVVNIRQITLEGVLTIK